MNSCTGFAGMNYTVELSDANGWVYTRKLIMLKLFCKILLPILLNLQIPLIPCRLSTRETRVLLMANISETLSSFVGFIFSCTMSSDLMSNFMYDPVNGIASAQLKSMFRFGNKLIHSCSHFSYVHNIGITVKS